MSDSACGQRPWSTCTPASITTGPADQTIAGGGTASLSVSGSGSSPVTYQWYDAGTQAPSDPSNPIGTPISGQTGTTYNTPPLTADHYYFAVAANACKRVISRVAHITVNTCNAPGVNSQSSDAPVAYQAAAHLSVTATGTATLHYQWLGDVESRSPEPQANNASRARAEWAPPTWSSGEYKYDGTGNIYAIGTSKARPATDRRTATHTT